MAKTRVWIDCDVGADDAAALLVAHKLEAMEIVGISAVAGNVPLAATYPNARKICHLMQAEYPVYAGAARPLVRKQITAAHIHGSDGLSGVELPLPGQEKLETLPAWDAMYQAALTHDNLELIATGPLTNVAIALAKYPALIQKLRRILIMGGAVVGGNRTPCAEFNIYADPEAAESVFRSGVPMVMCGLDVTQKAYLTKAELESIAALGSAQAKTFAAVLQPPLERVLRDGWPGVPVHDLCPALYAVYPALFTARQAGVFVETEGSVALGKTVADLDSDKKFADRHVTVALGIDRKGFVETVGKAMGKYRT